MNGCGIFRCANPLLLTACLAWPAAAADPPSACGDPENYPHTVYWGDTHLHTRNSPDAYMLGNMNLTPADAYRFARGETVVAHTGREVRLRRPLDFLVVSDHAEYLGAFQLFDMQDPRVVNTAAGKHWRELVEADDQPALLSRFTGSLADPAAHPLLPPESRLSIWRDVARTADDHNDPGAFTAFIGYEWTSMPDGDNLHRVIIFRDGAELAGQLPPFRAQTSADRRSRAGDTAQPEPVIRTHVSGNDPGRGAADARLRNDEKSLGADCRSHAGEGRQRNASAFFHHGRVCGL